MATEDADTSMADPLLNLRIDDRIESYQGYLPEEWMRATYQKAQPSPLLDSMLFDLALSWRTTAYTASMPATLVKCVQATNEGRAEVGSSDFSILGFGDAILAKLSRRIPELVDDRGLRGRLMEALVTEADGFRAARSALPTDQPIEPIWRGFLSLQPFGMGVWSSQRVAYKAFFDAYESFLVRCVKHALNVPKLKSTDKALKKALRTEFREGVIVPCWTNPELHRHHLVRNALTHAGGRETDELKNQKHGVLLHEGVLQIFPDDNHRLSVAACAVLAWVWLLHQWGFHYRW